jgi:hypothetical protein
MNDEIYCCNCGKPIPQCSGFESNICPHCNAISWLDQCFMREGKRIDHYLMIMIGSFRISGRIIAGNSKTPTPSWIVACDDGEYLEISEELIRKITEK